MKKLLTLTAASLFAISGAYAGDNQSADPSTTHEGAQSQMDQGSQIETHPSMQGEGMTDSFTQSDILQQKNPENLKGMEIIGADNINLGHVEKVVEDSNREKLVVVEVDELLQMDKKVVLQLNQLQLNEDKDGLHVSMTKDQLKSQQEYDSSLFTDYSEEEVEAE